MRTTVAILMLVVLGAGVVYAEQFTLLTGVDARYYPGTERYVVPVPGPGFPGSFFDGDRLAGTIDRSVDVVPFYGTGTPMYDPNEFGAMSFIFRRGSVPAGGTQRVPLQGVEFLGGPLLDLDGDLNNGSRSLVPVTNATPVEIPNTASYLDLAVDTGAGTIGLSYVDITGNNEGGPSIQAETATILVTMAGTANDGTPGVAINPTIDTRAGTLTAYTGVSGTLTSVYNVQNLGFELWEDTIDPTSSTAALLGTLQSLGAFSGWLIERDGTGQFPTLSGEGLGSTMWPAVDVSQAGNTFNTPSGGTATITTGPSADVFSAPNNGGVAMSDYLGDLGAYLDAVVVPLLPADATRFVYLEAAGFGINNSNDPIYMDSVSYDAVFIAAAQPCAGYVRGDSNCDGVVDLFDIDPFVIALTQGQASYESQFPGCSFLCNNDIDGNGTVDLFDIDPFVALLTGK